MSDVIEAKGSCLCGTVNFSASKVSKYIGACHCMTCQKWGGGPLLAVNSGCDVSFSGEKFISVYDSSPWAERGFCKKCGSHLFYRLKQQQEYIVPVGLFENSDDFVFQRQVFIDQKPAYYCFANDTENMTAAEIFAKYS